MTPSIRCSPSARAPQAPRQRSDERRRFEQHVRRLEEALSRERLLLGRLRASWQAEREWSRELRRQLQELHDRSSGRGDVLELVLDAAIRLVNADKGLDGGAIVAWTRNFPRKRMGIWVARMRPSGHFGRSHRLVLGGFPDLAIGPDGRGVLAWSNGDRIVAQVRHANGTWGPVERVATHRPALGSGIDTIDVAAGGRRLASLTRQTETAHPCIPLAELRSNTETRHNSA